MNCPNKQKNINDCNCTYEPCARKGVCCECLRYHRASAEFPACYFSADAEKTYDRSIKHFLRINGSTTLTINPEQSRRVKNTR